jgi:hypothetical protein
MYIACQSLISGLQDGAQDTRGPDITMPTKDVVRRIMSAQATDASKTLGVIFNGKAITTGQYIPRAGEYCSLFQLLRQRYII